jgi:hypothetical protein
LRVWGLNDEDTDSNAQVIVCACAYIHVIVDQADPCDAISAAYQEAVIRSRSGQRNASNSITLAAKRAAPCLKGRLKGASPLVALLCHVSSWAQRAKEERVPFYLIVFQKGHLRQLFCAPRHHILLVVQ